MEWWSSLWLNEGFATKTEYVGVMYSNPEYEIDRQYSSTALYAALRADALADVQQLTSAVASSAEVEGMFSAISYSKGGSILRQVEAFLGSLGALVPANAFYGGISAYIAKNAYANAEPAALWASFAAVSTIAPLAAWMSTYELRPGFALVSVAWANPDGKTSGAGSLVLSQARFFASPASRAAAAPADAATQWWSPMSFVTEHPSPPVLAAIATAAQCSSTTPACAFVGAGYANAIPYSIATDGFLKLNANGTSYYRVAYPKNLWAALFASAAAQVRANASAPLSAGDRGELVDDLLSIAEAALPEQLADGVNSVFALGLLRDLLGGSGGEAAYEALTPALFHLSAVYSFLMPDVAFASAGVTAASPFDGASGAADRACLASFSSFAARLVEPTLARLGGFSNAATASVPLLVQLQASALNAASFFNSSTYVSQANALYASWDQAPVDFQAAILRSAARWSVAGDGVWLDMQQQYYDLSLVGSSAANRVLGALTATFDRAQLQLALDMIATVRVGDRVGIISGVAANPFGRDLALKYIKSHWAELYAAYGPGGFDLSSIVRASGAGFVTDEYAAAVRAFFATNPVPGASHDLAQALEGIGQRVNYRLAGEKAAVCAWLGTQGA